MKQKLLLFFSLCCATLTNAQCGGTPPPPGYTYVYGLDTDNDGFALFDIQYFADYVTRPELEDFFGVSSSGYYPVFNVNGIQQSSMLYTNTSQNQEAGLEFIYSGSGTQFEPQPPCYWNVEIYSGRGLLLITVPFDGDFDNDGVLNTDEDANRNGNLMDDDDDHDGLINLKDTDVLGTHSANLITLTVYPNPVTNGTLTFESSVSISSVAIYDLSGKQLFHSKIESNSISVESLAAGIYFVKFQSDSGVVFKKIGISQ